MSKISGVAPAVSIVLPAYNVAAYIEEAVASALAQTCRQFELIVINDGSEDCTAEILRDLAATVIPADSGFRVIHTRNRGTAAARNTGIQAATAPLIAFLDGDDRWEITLLEAAIEILQNEPGIDLVFPQYRHIDHHGRDTGSRGRSSLCRFEFRDIFVRNPIHSATGVVVRRDAIEKAGGFDERLASNVDFDLWLRISALRSGNIESIQEVLVDYRRRPGQLTDSWRRMAENWEIVLAKSRQLAPRVVAQLEDAARANQYVYWSTLARRDGEHKQARRLMKLAWRAAPLVMALSLNSWVATLVSLTTVLPSALQQAVLRLTRNN